jgi:hypothetical protein
LFGNPAGNRGDIDFNIVPGLGKNREDGTQTRQNKNIPLHGIRAPFSNNPPLTGASLGCPALHRIATGNIYTVSLPLPPINEGAEMIGGQQEGKTKTDKGKGYEDRGVEVGFGDPADNSQGKDEDIDGADAVKHSQEEKDLRYVGLLFPKR